MVRAAGRTDDALWMGEKECDEKEEDDDATRYASRLPDALVSAWHVDTPQLAAHAPGETSGEDRIASAVLGNGGTHVLAAAPGLFAFARATRAPRRRRETSASASAAETSVSSDSSDSEEDASRVAREVSVRGVTEMAERRFRDARLARHEHDVALGLETGAPRAPAFAPAHPVAGARPHTPVHPRGGVGTRKLPVG